MILLTNLRWADVYTLIIIIIQIHKIIEATILTSFFYGTQPKIKIAKLHFALDSNISIS